MKNLLLVLFTSFMIISCDKDENPQPINPVDQLPPATQTGKNTFGCLLDGKVFTPGNVSNPVDCQYQLIEGDYYFGIDGARRFDSNNYIAIGLGTIKVQLIEGNTYSLLEQEDGKANGAYFKDVSTTYTSIINTGELKITKLDNVKQIISGTFWFDILDSQGIKHEIREGRFDMQFTM